MDSNPYSLSTGFVDFLLSQQGVSVPSLPSLVTDATQGVCFSSLSQPESSQPPETMTEEVHPMGVKAAKGKKKKGFDGKETVSQIQALCELKQQDFQSKERLSKMKILDRLLGKKDGLDEFEDRLKKKLIEELF
ncbi:hypothetical protein Bca4012_020989 [Brassica carinata]